MAHLVAPVTIKRYAHQRRYAPAVDRDVTARNLDGMVEDEEAFVVRDAASGGDITPLLLKPIIIERARHG